MTRLILSKNGGKKGSAGNVGVYLNDHFNREIIKDTLMKYLSNEDIKWFYSGVDNIERAKFIIKLVSSIDKELSLINNRGFVPGFELDDVGRFPITSKFFYDLLKEDAKGVKITIEDVDNINKVKLVRWWFNIIQMDMFILLICLRESPDFIESVSSDELEDIKVLCNEKKNTLDSYIRLALAKGGLSINQNIYTGFDTEYVYESGNRNRLLSAQLAVCSRLVVKLPNLKDFYRLSGVNTVTNEVYNLNQVNPCIDLDYVNEVLNSRIQFLRGILYPGFDRSIKLIEKGLIKRGIPWVIKGDNIYFMFDKSVLKTWFSIDVINGISLVELVKKSNEISQGDLEKATEDLWNLFKELYEFGYNSATVIDSNKGFYPDGEEADNRILTPEEEEFVIDGFDKEELDELDELDELGEMDESGDSDENSNSDSNSDSDTNSNSNSETNSGTIYDADSDSNPKSNSSSNTRSNSESNSDSDSSFDSTSDSGSVSTSTSNSVSTSKSGSDSKAGKADRGDFKFDRESFNDSNIRECTNMVLENGKLGDGKKYSRTYKQSFTSQKVSVTIKKNNYILSHYNAADLSMLSDFEIFKHDLDIVNKGFVTLKKPLLIDGVNVIFRDTMLLAPGGNKRLNDIGALYDLPKIEIGERIRNMDLFLKEDYDLFKKYAIQDSKISLVHGLYMEEFSFQFGLVGIPLSLSMLSSVYLRKSWLDLGYDGYQINPEYYVNDSAKTQTPKGLFFTGDVGLHISYYISNYKGGRNESFMYGMDDLFEWFDYDLVSAYTTGMSLMKDPDYSKAKMISRTILKNMKKERILFDYLAIKCSFEFPDSVKYPSIPCYMDEYTTLYPKSGNGILTGPEYLLALEQGCHLDITEVYHIPYRDSDDNKGGKVIPRPFFNVIKELQGIRSKYLKGTINNLLYKELGNSIYGLIARGISNKRKYDIKTSQTVRMEGNDLSNPVIASWITAFIRSVIGEMLHNIQLLGGRIISVTTDGFLTDIPDLEEKLLKMLKTNQLFMLYRSAREALSGNSNTLELKENGVGVITWTTRGQFSLHNLMAATGFQRGMYNKREIYELFKEGISSDSKEILYLNKRLRSSLDVYKQGGNVTTEYRDQIFRLMHDNKRKMIMDDKSPKSALEGLFDSIPLNDIREGALYRYIVKVPYHKKYQRRLSTKVFKNKYKNVLEIIVRNFIRCLLTNSMNLDNSVFKNYQDIIDYIHSYDKDLRLTTNVIAQLKRRSSKPKKLYLDDVVGNFIDFVTIKFPDFDRDKFFNEYSVEKKEEIVKNDNDNDSDNTASLHDVNKILHNLNLETEGKQKLGNTTVIALKGKDHDTYKLIDDKIDSIEVHSNED